MDKAAALSCSGVRALCCQSPPKKAVCFEKSALCFLLLLRLDPSPDSSLSFLEDLSSFSPSSRSSFSHPSFLLALCSSAQRDSVLGAFSFSYPALSRCRTYSKAHDVCRSHSRYELHLLAFRSCHLLLFFPPFFPHLQSSSEVFLLSLSSLRS